MKYFAKTAKKLDPKSADTYLNIPKKPSLSTAAKEIAGTSLAGGIFGASISTAFPAQKALPLPYLHTDKIIKRLKPILRSAKKGAKIGLIAGIPLVAASQIISHIRNKK